MNSLTHGCRSQKLIIKGEKQEDFDALLANLMDHYRPGSPVFRNLVEELARAQWLLWRNQRTHDAVYAKLAEEVAPEDWGDAEHKRIQLYTRYLTAARNDFRKAMQDVEHFQKSAMDAMLKMDARAEHKRDRMEKRYQRSMEPHLKQIDWIEKHAPDTDLAEKKQSVEAMRQALHETFRGLDLWEVFLDAAVRVGRDATGFGGEIRTEEICPIDLRRS